VVLVRRLAAFREIDHDVLEREEHPRIDLQRQVQVEGALASVFGVQIHLPRLAKGVRLDEMTLVVDVEPVIHGMVFELCHIPSYIDDRHFTDSTAEG